MTLYEEYDARYEAWQREQTLASLDDCGIILPMDTSSAAWRRDYADRWKWIPYKSEAVKKHVNVFKFYACCALIVGAVYVAVKVVAK